MITAVLAGVAAMLFLGGKKKARSSKGKTGESSKIPLPRPKLIPAGETSLTRKISGESLLGEPWSWCKAPEGSPKGVYAAFSKDGKECMIFWKPDTRDIIRQLIQNELTKLPKDKRDALCKMDECKPDPFAPDPMAFCEWIPDQNRIDFIKKIVLTLWPQVGVEALPPKENSTYFVKFVWDQTFGVLARDFCNFGLIT